LKQGAEPFRSDSINVSWPSYERPEGRTWQMDPARRVIYENTDAEAQAEWKARQIIRMMDRNGISAKTICELGVLSSLIVEKLSRQLPAAATISGHEVPLAELELNDCRADPVLTRYLDDILAESRPFDLLLILDVMEHIENYHGFLRAVRTIGTYKILHLPMDLTVQTLARPNALKRRRDTFLHISYFTKDTIMRALVDTGYEVIDSFYTPWRIQFSRELTGKLMKLPRQLLFAISPDTAVRLLGGYSLMILVK
jgi:hypothetical protein